MLEEKKEKIVDGKVMKVNSVLDAKDAREIKKKGEEESGKVIVEYFNDEEKNNILVYTANDPTDKYFYIPEKYKTLPQDKAPIFKFLCFNGEIEENFYDVLWNAKDNNGNSLLIRTPSDFAKICKSNKTVRTWLLKNILVSFKNYRTSKGIEINCEFDEDGRISNNTLDIIPLILKMELAYFAFGSKFISEEEQLSLKF